MEDTEEVQQVVDALAEKKEQVENGENETQQPEVKELPEGV